MHPFVWAAALGAVFATPVVVIATLLGALVFQALNPTATQLSSLARQKRLGPRRREGVMSGDPACAEGALCTSQPLKPLPAVSTSRSLALVSHRMVHFKPVYFP